MSERAKYSRGRFYGRRIIIDYADSLDVGPIMSYILCEAAELAPVEYNDNLRRPIARPMSRWRMSVATPLCPVRRP